MSMRAHSSLGGHEDSKDSSTSCESREEGHKLQHDSGSSNLFLTKIKEILQMIIQYVGKGKTLFPGCCYTTGCYRDLLILQLQNVSLNLQYVQPE